MIASGKIRQYLWVLIFPLSFIVYAGSFNSFAIIEKKYDVLADADSANFIILIRDFHLAKKYGDEYNTKNRSLGDIAQKHKIHHVLYAFVSSLIYKGLSFLYQLLGMAPEKAVYAVNALLSCCNMGLLYILLRRFGCDNRDIGPYLLLYAFSLGTWIYSSIPESWTFSATLILGFLVLFYRKRPNLFILSLYIGLSMLNNVLLASLLLFPFMEYLSRENRAKEAIKKIVAAGIVAESTWMLALTVLSFFDESFGVSNFVRYTLWFKEFCRL